jgi:hypothetical protein
VDSNPVPALRVRNLLIMCVALAAGTALSAVVGYSFGTDRSRESTCVWFDSECLKEQFF